MEGLCSTQTKLSSRPERSRISCYAAPDMSAHAAFSKESRMKFANATNLHRKFGVAQWRDLLFLLAVQSLSMSGDEHVYYVYMVASRSHVLYCGVTNNLQRRVEQHRSREIEGFSADYKCTRLVWFERFQYINNALAREKQIKRWRREKKVFLIEQTNLKWDDLSEAWTPRIC